MMLWFDISAPSRALAYSRHFSNKGGVLVAASEQEAQKLSTEMSFYDPKLSGRILYLPDNETLPFDLQRAPSTIMSERASVFFKLAVANKKSNHILVVSASNCLRLCSNLSFWAKNHHAIIPGMSLNASLGGKSFAKALENLGYNQVSYVKSPGTWAARGLVVDMYPVGSALSDRGEEHLPVRISLDKSGRILSIKKLDMLTQESFDIGIQQLNVFPNREYGITKELIEGFRKGSFAYHSDPRSVDSYKAISAGLDHPELSSWIASSGDWASIAEISPAGDVIFDGDVEEALATQWSLINERHADLKNDPSRIAPPISMAWQSPDDLHQCLKSRKHVRLGNTPIPSGMKRLGSLKDALSLLKALIEEKKSTLFVMKSEVRYRHIRTMCSMLGWRTSPYKSFNDFEQNPSDLGVMIGDLTDGFTTDGSGYRVITETEVFGSSIESAIEEELGAHQRKVIVQGLGALQIGDPIVHALIGIGRFQGFEDLDLGAGKEEMLKIGFAKEASSFVRVSDLDMVSRYTGADPDKAPLTRIGDDSWMKDLQVAQRSAFKTAAELIEIRNARQRAVGIKLNPPDEKYASFCETFPYDETADQKKAVDDILRDLSSGKPMDRLICGDVGFGKTEVAMRAAFLVASQGFQVVFLAPTTILAEQHFQSACKRFEDTNIPVKLASKKSLSLNDLREMKSGEPCIWVGTHRLLQSDIEFGKLGLTIVDEEHRFGVNQKEMLRTMRGDKHMLAMAATPIPRTLSMAIYGIRDISIIATPPARRLSVRTLVRNNHPSVIREALSREMARGGQVFYLHNRIESMDECIEEIQQVSPKARIRKIHGRMSEKEMTDVMFSFRKHEFDVLVSTTVIEVGIDVPNANTLIVGEAGNLGLAQLHQLRGRVGRSNKQAYAYLLTREREGSVSMRRLKAMELSTNLGEGIIIARHDMEIRGIGEILGEEQSGHIHNVGFALYMRLLEHAIKALDKGESSPESAVIMANVNMPVQGKIDEHFMPESGERLAWYQRLMASESTEELEVNIREMKDIYGYIPSELKTLRDSVKSHIAARNLGITSVRQNGKEVTLEAHGSANLGDLWTFLKSAFPGRVSSEKARFYSLANTTVEAVLDALAKDRTKSHAL